MNEYPDFHGDSPIYHSTVKAKCKNCECEKKCTCEPGKECACVKSCNCGDNCPCKSKK